MAGKLTGAGAILLIGAVLAVGGNYAASRVRNKIEREVAERLPSMIGPASSYKVHVSAGLDSLLMSRLRYVDVNGKNVRMQNGLVIDTLHARMRGISFDAGKAQLKRATDTTVDARLSQASIVDYMSGLYPDFSDLDIRIGDGIFFVSGKPYIGGLRPTVEAEGTLVLERETAICVHFSRIRAAGLPAPGFVVSYVTEKFNPIFNTSSLGIDLRLKDVTLEPGFVHLKGSADITHNMIR